jgi:hypothetical protein
VAPPPKGGKGSSGALHVHVGTADGTEAEMLAEDAEFRGVA